MIKYCPNCKSELSNNPKLAALVKECKNCGGKYFQVETTTPNKYTSETAEQIFDVKSV